MKSPNLNQLWADLLLATLAKNGVHHVIIAPGSRCAPLVTAAVRNPDMETLVHYDERGAAFAALGSAKMGFPCAVICTSGTALSNCFPAVAEARQSATPLIIISADRPPELQDCGANQTMNQQGIFGSFVLAEMTIPCPNSSIPPERMLMEVNPVIAASGKPGQGGPVHLNCMYREPLSPVCVNPPWPTGYTQGLADWQAKSRSREHTKQPITALTDEQLQQISATISQAENGLLLIGHLASQEEQAAALDLATKLSWPVFADITSGCRRADTNNNRIFTYDLLLRSELFRNCCVPDVVVHIGDVFVSKRLYEYLEGIHPEYIQITCRKDTRDPVHRVTRRFQVDIEDACWKLANVAAATCQESRLLPCCQRLHQAVEIHLANTIETSDSFSELAAVAEVNAFISTRMGLFVGNSMPIRNMDMIINDCAASILCANRGVSGIDGNIATAAGMAWGSQSPTVAIMGDMAALHDLNSLALLAKVNVPIVLVVINNKGGGIFSFLPIASHTDLVDPYFINSHNWQFDKACSMFGLPYYAATNREELVRALKNASENGSASIVEVIVDREDNMLSHNALIGSVASMIETMLSSQ